MTISSCLMEVSIFTEQTDGNFIKSGLLKILRNDKEGKNKQEHRTHI